MVALAESTTVPWMVPVCARAVARPNVRTHATVLMQERNMVLIGTPLKDLVLSICDEMVPCRVRFAVTLTPQSRVATVRALDGVVYPDSVRLKTSNPAFAGATFTGSAVHAGYGPAMTISGTV